MSDDLKNCPFCGSAALPAMGWGVTACSNLGCSLGRHWTPVEDWNRRPREDAFSGENLRLREVGDIIDAAQLKADVTEGGNG